MWYAWIYFSVGDAGNSRRNCRHCLLTGCCVKAQRNIRLPQLPENWTIMVHGWNYPVLRTMLTLLFIHWINMWRKRWKWWSRWLKSRCFRKRSCIRFWILISNNIWSIPPRWIFWHIVVCYSLFTENNIHVGRLSWRRIIMLSLPKFFVIFMNGIIIRAIALFFFPARWRKILFDGWRIRSALHSGNISCRHRN